jgi:hypothetical protein
LESLVAESKPNRYMIGSNLHGECKSGRLILHDAF